MSTPPYFFHCAEDFYLRPLRASDVTGRWWQWFNDPEVTRFQAKGYYPNTPESQAQYFASLQGSRTQVVLAIVDRATDLHLGNVGLHEIDPLHRTAVLGIVLGEAAARGRRIGTRAWEAITDYGFLNLNLHKICATFFDGNTPSMKCALAAGYEVEGRQAAQLFKDGRYVDLHHVGLRHARWAALRAAKGQG